MMLEDEKPAETVEPVPAAPKPAKKPKPADTAAKELAEARETLKRLQAEHAAALLVRAASERAVRAKAQELQTVKDWLIERL